MPSSLPLEAHAGTFLKAAGQFITLVPGVKKAMCSDRGGGATAHLLRLLSIIAIEVT